MLPSSYFPKEPIRSPLLFTFNLRNHFRNLIDIFHFKLYLLPDHIVICNSSCLAKPHGINPSTQNLKLPTTFARAIITPNVSIRSNSPNRLTLMLSLLTLPNHRPITCHGPFVFGGETATSMGTASYRRHLCKWTWDPGMVLDGARLLCRSAADQFITTHDTLIYIIFVFPIYIIFFSLYLAAGLFLFFLFLCLLVVSYCSSWPGCQLSTAFLSLC